ncbi:M56 family metallopeptidase [uncultured Arcticibacterium sp.]|uniref:M56 family metallopeptidase n=1 Tax=uncultured Arcticibacterium sp. TaxID=2173042 RepID=UPI0030F9C621
MNWITYILQVNLYLIVTFGFYWLLLRKETFYNANRFYLLTASILSFSIPFWQSGIIQSWAVTAQVSTVVKTIPLAGFTVTNLAETPTWDWNLLLANIYFLGFGFGLLRFSIGLLKLQQLFSLSNIDGQAFSVFGKIFIDKKLDHYDVIKNHEEVHSKEFHSLDVFWFELLGALCWFNPIAHFMQKEIKLVHEYIADAKASEQLGSKKAYAQVLVSSHFKTNSNVLVNHFYNKSILKTRIMMLSKEKSKKKALLKYGFTAPLFLGMLVLATACVDNDSKLQPSTDLNETVVVGYGKKSSETEGQIFTAVENSPEFPGGTQELYRHISREIIYPATAQRAGIEGRVFVKFVVRKDGTVGDATILKGLGFGCDEAALSVLETMPTWKPGTQNGKPVNVYFTMPFFFELEKEVETSQTPPPPPSIKKGTPLYYVDNKLTSLEAVKKLNMNNVNTLTVLEEQDAIDKYGKTPHGVVEIIMK